MMDNFDISHLTVIATVGICLLTLIAILLLLRKSAKANVVLFVGLSGSGKTVMFLKIVTG